MSKLDRRSFLAASAASSSLFWPLACSRASQQKLTAGRPVVISSGNGIPAVTRAMEGLNRGEDPADAVVEGVTLVEDDPNDMSVGYGGLPNEGGVVQLDASVMHGPTHKAGAVAAIENIRNPARVALKVLRHTDHVMIVGDGARRFAKAMGFKEENLLTDKAREVWLKWKRNLNPNDDWLDEDQSVDHDARQAMAESLGIAYSHGTIHCGAVDANGDVAACTTTSGLSYKIPGRVGDSPIIGAGMFVDNEVGAAGATGRGESVIQSCGAFQIVQHMAAGDEPTAACLKVLRWIADHTKRRMLLNQKGEPNFGVTLYAVRRDGLYGSASMHSGAHFTVHDGTEARSEDCAFLYEREPQDVES
ncbi:MAG: N(4)-(beta-N-acetylglucosaminyl)-L-asparaginase [Phycisphaerales bacterium]|nr:MAG: N(4)-(beta-N-acetylglucosaminyl)-L-asparaginase [Phycisphaerales bacterium]